ncbi:hypothetical protein B0H14DRAFT_3525860 [Mycena olivaceomarginata]|nr:hypothetical protein B0H14DRAFT_3525860 [Mycena olivaceomarginata]
MLWNLNTRTTRSGTVFSAWTAALNFAPLLSRAVATETEDDHESDDDDDVDGVDEGTPLNDASGIDKQWPPPDPMNDIDDVWPLPDLMNDVDDVPPAAPSLKRRASPSFEDVLATAPALSGPHCRRPAPHSRRALKRARAIETEGYTPRPSTVAAHVMTAARLPLPAFNASSMPAALGA